MNKKNCLIVLIIIINLVIFNNALAQTTCENGVSPPCDEQATFTSVAPNAFFVLDFSGSMANAPDNNIYGNIYGSSSCSGPFYSTSSSGHKTDCSKQAILKRAIFSILDYDANNTINSSDSDGLDVQIGYMRFVNCNSQSDVPSCISTIRGVGAAYSQIYCGSTTSCASTVTSCSGSGECIVGTSANGGTPLATALGQAKTYLDSYKSTDPAGSCRQNFVIVVTDGADTFACNGNGGDCQAGMYELRRQTVAAVKQLYDAGYKVFVVGFGSTMPLYLQNTLNWMAYYGGTVDPLMAQSGSITGYNLPLGCNSKTPVPSACCNLTSNAAACFPAGPPAVTSCHADTSTFTDPTNPSDPYYDAECTGTYNFFATYNDPGYTPLSGYAFIATNTTDMKRALASAINTIKESVYTFSQASVQAVRTQDENFLYEASFQPVNNDPFWIGHLKKYQLDNYGNISPTALWDAGSVLSNQSSRNVFTLKNGAITAFNTTNILPADLNLASTDTTDQTMIVNYIVNGETSPDVTNWKLGDIFHSYPVTIGTPSSYYYDSVDQSQYTCPNNTTSPCNAYTMYSQNHQRDTSGQRIILVGDNDGQLHAFVTDNAYEAWSFIPPDIRNKLYLVAHPAHPTAYDATALTHQYFMDGYTTYSEVWLGTGNGQYKSPSDWHTLLIAGEGRGGNTNLWSQSLYCDANFNATYATSARTPVYYRNYCGYYAFDLTATTLTPQFLWRIGSNTALTTGTNGTAAYLGQPWSKMVMARVIINGNEKWVGFIGGGYSGNNCTSTTCDTRGKGFYVIDLKTGNVLWSYTYGQNNSMAYDLAANPAVVDTDNDGFVDTAYIGDLGGNVWRFTFCPKNNTSCGISNWTGGMFYNAGSGGGQIFHMDAVTKDTSGNLWVYFGTGNETDPTNVPTNGTTDKFFGLIDKNPIVQLPPPSTTPITLGNLKNITSGTFNPATDVNTYSGWVINFTTAGEKVLAEATVFQGSIYFTTYLPGSASDPCNQSGTAYYYAINYVTGAGLFANNARSINIGVGIPSSPIVSVGPTGYISVYASTSASGSSGGPATKSLNIGNPPQTCPISPCPPSPTAGGPKGLLYYWLDKRLQ